MHEINPEIAAHNIATILTQASISETDKEQIFMDTKGAITDISIDYWFFARKYSHIYSQYYEHVYNRFIRDDYIIKKEEGI